MGKMIMIFLIGFMHSAVVFGQIDEAAIEIDAIPGKVGIDMKEVDDALVVRKARKGVILEDVSEDGIMIQQAMGDGMRIQKSMDDGIDIDSTSDFGIIIDQAGTSGVYISSAGQSGFWISQAGNPSLLNFPFNAEENGLTVAGAEDHGIFIGQADQDGLHVQSAGMYGIRASGDLAAGYFDGKVGIGTGSPSSLLHLLQPSGDLSISLETGNSWTAKITQTPSSFLRFENGGAPRLSIKHDGNVGIGVSDPSERLDVSGNIKVRGHLTWDPITSYVAIDARAFNAQISDREHHFVQAGLSPRTDFKTGRPAFVANVSIPHGAIITTISAYVDDSFASEDIDILLSRHGVTGSTESMASGSSSGSGGNQTIIMTNIAHSTIDNQNWSYGSHAEFPDFDIGGFNYLRSVIIEYTIDGPY